MGFDEKRLVDLLLNLLEERMEIVLERHGLIENVENGSEEDADDNEVTSGDDANPSEEEDSTEEL